MGVALCPLVSDAALAMVRRVEARVLETALVYPIVCTRVPLCV